MLLHYLVSRNWILILDDDVTETCVHVHGLLLNLFANFPPEIYQVFYSMARDVSVKNKTVTWVYIFLDYNAFKKKCDGKVTQVKEVHRRQSDETSLKEIVSTETESGKYANKKTALHPTSSYSSVI